MPLRKEALPENSLIVRSDYLKGHSGVKDLIRRLQELAKVLAEDESIVPDSNEWPGLASLAHLLVTKEFLHHKAKDVRLYTVLCCMEIFAIYAPEIPWDQDQIIDIFDSTNEQLGNLAHTTGPTYQYFHVYNRILELLAEVKIGIVLVELAQQTGDEQAKECLAQLIGTLLNVAHNDHPHQVINRIVTSIIACLDEYDIDRGTAITIPIQVIDAILLTICSGPTRIELKQGQSAVPVKTEVPNASYAAAAAVIRKTHNKSATPIAELVNAILNGDEIARTKSTILIEQSKDKNDVWTVIYQLNKIAPQMLTTIMGTVANLLESTHTDTRLAAVQLLGKLFASSDTTITQFHSCFTLWLRRHKDIESTIRRKMVSSLVRIVVSANDTAASEATQHLILTSTDPSSEVRLACIHETCETLYALKNEAKIPESLLKAIGDRVASKHKQERRDALTGISRIYQKHYILPKLRQVQEGGDDVEIGVILSVLHKECPSLVRGKRTSDETSKYQWIPRLVFESAFYKDADDTEMRSRVIKIIDEILLGSELSTSSKPMSPTSRATALAIIMDGFSEADIPLEQTKTHKFLVSLFTDRALLQSKLSAYIDARNDTRQCQPGTEEMLSKDAKAIRLLEEVATLCPPLEKPEAIVKAVHGIRDQHVFRILASLTQAKHSSRSRKRAHAELPKRVQSAGNAAVEWIGMLIRRCSMGDFFNVDTVSHCCILAQESLFENDVVACSIFLASVKAATSCFPSLASTGKVFTTLTELFNACRSSADSRQQKAIRATGLLTTLTAILSVASVDGTKSKAALESAADENFEAGLLQLVRDGTPEQAAKAVRTLCGLYSKYEPEKEVAFTALLKILTSPARLTLSVDSSKMVSSLAGLSALAESNIEAFDSDKGSKAIKFALDGVLLGKSLNDRSVDDSSVSTSRSSPSPRKKRKSSASRTDDPKDLSDICQGIVAAIDFLATYIRSACMSKPSGEQKQKIFSLASRFLNLTKEILADDGLPPSHDSRAEFDSPTDRAALRRNTALHMMRLCDGRLGLDPYFGTDVWHALGKAFLDEDLSVRECILDEFTDYLTGTGSFSSGTGQAKAPSLRFVAYAVLCSNGSHNGNKDPSNGGAAHAPSKIEQIRRALYECITRLRQVCDATYSHCKSMGKEGEEQFEKRYKMKFMPEYALPHAFHLLSYREETPEAGGDDSEDDNVRVLHKRLSMLIDPLVQSLGEAADNISFLMRMSEIFAKNFVPSPIEGSDLPASARRSKLRQVCVQSRKVLLSFVKKDVNLEAYPGQIHIPRFLFVSSKQTSSAEKKARHSEIVQSQSQSTVEPTATQSTVEASQTSMSLRSPGRPTRFSQRRSSGSVDLAQSSRSKVHFSPEVDFKARSKKDFQEMSPIPKSASPSSLVSSGSKRKSPSTASAATLRAATQSTYLDGPESPVSTSRDSTPTRSSKRSRRESISQSPDDKPVSGIRAMVLGKSGKSSSGSSVPAQIKVRKSPALKRVKSVESDDLDFDAENPRKNSKSSRKSSTKTQSRALRTRGG